MTATIAILGRPNVGKSTLFNRLVGRKIALVDDQPGVTRDRREGEGRIGDLSFRVFDTAGLDDAPKGSLEQRMSAQAVTAVDEADLVFFVIDSRAGVTPIDERFAERIRRLGKPVVVVANKAEGREAMAGVNEAYGLGFGEPLAVSAEHGEGLDQLYDAIMPYAGENEEEDDAAVEAEDDEAYLKRPLRLAIIGQPNAGKSTLVNTLLGEERMLTGPEAGITRDAISTDWEWQGRKIKLWDTAGIRRKSKVTGKVEKLAVSDALRAIRFADCVIVLIDASMKIERQDLALSDLVAGEGRAVVLALSKWDIVEEKQKTLAEVKSDLEDVLPEIRGVPVVTLSSKQEKGLDKLMAAVFGG
jgi:GTP-binding protein